MESKVTMFSDGKVLIQDTEKMKTINNEIAEVIIKEYMTTKENLINILNVVEKIEQENVTTENEKIVTAETINKENIEQNQTETNSTEETKE